MKIFDCIIETADIFLCSFWNISDTLLFFHPLCLLREFLLRNLTVQRYLRKVDLHISKQAVHILLMFKIALLFFAIIIFNHEIRQRAKCTFTGKSTFTHRNSFENTLHRLHRNIVSSFYVETVQINGFLTNTTWSKFSACLFVFRQFHVGQWQVAQSLWFQHLPQLHSCITFYTC